MTPDTDDNLPPTMFNGPAALVAVGAAIVTATGLAFALRWLVGIVAGVM